MSEVEAKRNVINYYHHRAINMVKNGPLLRDESKEELISYFILLFWNDFDFDEKEFRKKCLEKK
jgi:hypothetical protein